MNTKLSEKMLHVLIIFIFILGTIGMPLKTVGARPAEEAWSNARFIAWPIRSHLSLFDWAGGGVTIYLPSNSATVGTSTDQFGRLELPYGYGYPADSIITIDDETIIKELIVAPLNITDVDPDAETISGTTSPGARVDIEDLCNGTSCVFRHAIADENGMWQIDFSLLGSEEDEQTTFDLINGMHHSVIQYDEDGDATAVDWYAPQWPIAIDSGGPYAVYVGESVTFDASASSAPDGEVLTYGWDLDNDGLYNNAIDVTATASYEQTGEYTINLRAVDSLGFAYKDTTTVVVKENLPPPTIEALGTNKLGGYGWPLGFEVTITIDDPSNGAGVDYEVVQMPFDDPQNPGISTLDVPIEGTFKLKPGYVIQATNEPNGQITKTLVYTYLEVTQVDTITETIHGVSDPNVDLHVQSGGVSLDVTADSNGNWQADFQGIYNLTSSTRGQVRQTDTDGDAIVQFWGGLPVMYIYLLDNGVQGLRWSVGDPVTLTIDDPDNGQGVDYTDTQTVEVAWWNPDETNVEFYFEPFELQPDQLITMTDGDIIITHIVTNLAVTGVDTDADTVTGTANPGSLVEVGWLCDENGCAFRRISADVNGDWLIDFSTPGEDSDEQDLFDIRPGATIDVQHKDDFGNVESIYWNVPLNQSPTANAGEPYSSYWSSNIALDASASSDPDGDVLTYEWDLDNDGQYDDASSVTVTTSFNQVGYHTVGLRVTDDDGLSDTDTATVTVLPWTLTGFYQPVDMNGVYNTVKGGSTVPLKFEIFAGPTELTDIASVRSLTYAQTSCDATAITDEVETTATGNTSLRYADGQFIYNWKTPKLPGKCYRVTMTTMDGSSLMAYFKFK